MSRLDRPTPVNCREIKGTPKRGDTYLRTLLVQGARSII
ncbi:hypothetical protein F01_550074 [Burkholderia cenocepacia]|nr:hypothetical protein F01_550074 [Burkholderia cenocepacia]